MFVARMERSEIRDSRSHLTLILVWGVSCQESVVLLAADPPAPKLRSCLGWPKGYAGSGALRL